MSMTKEEKLYLYVVEGVTDVDKLKKLSCKFVLPTGGKYIRDEILRFIKNISEVRNVIIVTDPDTPGRLIENKIKEIVPDATSVHAKKSKAIKNGKVGIAQMDLKDLYDLLKDYIKHDLESKELDLYSSSNYFPTCLTGENSMPLRKKLIDKYSIPYNSVKKVKEAMMMLNKTSKEIKQEALLNG